MGGKWISHNMQLPTNIDREYSGTSDNGLPLLRKPPQCGQEAVASNTSLQFTVHSNLRIAITSRRCAPTN